MLIMLFHAGFNLCRNVVSLILIMIFQYLPDIVRTFVYVFDYIAIFRLTQSSGCALRNFHEC